MAGGDRTRPHTALRNSASLQITRQPDGGQVVAQAGGVAEEVDEEQVLVVVFAPLLGVEIGHREQLQPEAILAPLGQQPADWKLKETLLGKT